MTERQLDAMIDRQIEQYEAMLDRLNDEHWQEEWEQIKEEEAAHKYYSESYSY